MGFDDRPSVFLDIDDDYLFDKWRQTAQDRPLIEVIEAEAKRGGRLSQRALGEILLYGRGTQKDVPHAIYWLKRAAAQGEERAPELLGTLSEAL